METEGKIIRIFTGFFTIVAAILIVVVGFLLVQKNRNIDYQSQSEFLAAANQTKNMPLPSSVIDVKPLVRMLFFGDLMLDRNIVLKIKQKGLDYIFEKIKNADLFKNKDIIFCNLEGALTNSGAHYPPSYAYDFAFSPEITGQLKNYGFNFFNLANNHLADQGERGISETRQNLDELGFNYSGCPDGQIDECSVKILKIKEQKIGLAGFSAVYAKLDQEKLAAFVSDLASSTDLLLVNIHWGNEYQHNFSQYQQELAHALIDSGANLVIGHHPHVVQGLEIYQGKPIFYSLGNFIFDQYFSVDTQQGLALDASLDSDKMEILLIPLESSQGQVSLMAEANKDNFLQKLAGWSETGTDYFEQIKSGRLILER